jgi:plasmid stabilization system protein ParE
MSGYTFHPDAFADLDETWEYIAQDNIDAADRLLADIHAVLRPLTRICGKLHLIADRFSPCGPGRYPRTEAAITTRA